MERTSKILRLSAVDSLSFSDYANLGGCLVRSWPGRHVLLEGQGSNSPKSRASVVGLFYHDMLKRLDGAYELGYEDGVRHIRSTFSELIGVYRSRYVDTLTAESTPLDYWPEITSIVRSAIQVFERDLDEDCKPTREKILKSERLRIHGIVDEILESNESVLITEYKTIQHASRLDQERHLDQVHFYTLLAREHYKKSVAARLCGLLGTSFEVNIEEDRLELISRRVKEFFERASGVAEESDVQALCDVSRETCPGCRYRRSCPAILGSSYPSIGDGHEIAVLSNIMVVDGKIVAKIIAGTIPIGHVRVVDPYAISLLKDLDGDLVVDELVFDDGELSFTTSSRIHQLNTLS